MRDFIFYAQLIVLILNIVVFIVLMNEHTLNFKLARIVLLIAISVGAVINFGKVTIFTIIFSFTPFITLIKLRHGNIKRLGNYFRGFIKHFQNHKRDNTTIKA